MFLIFLYTRDGPFSEAIFIFLLRKGYVMGVIKSSYFMKYHNHTEEKKKKIINKTFI